NTWPYREWSRDFPFRPVCRKLHTSEPSQPQSLKDVCVIKVNPTIYRIDTIRQGPFEARIDRPSWSVSRSGKQQTSSSIDQRQYLRVDPAIRCNPIAAVNRRLPLPIGKHPAGLLNNRQHRGGVP